MKIIYRDIITTAKKHLKTDEILLFTGARQAGKTTILKYLMQEIENSGGKTFFLNLEDPSFLAELNTNPKNLLRIIPIDLASINYVFIDEIQYLANPTNFLKYLYDEYAGRIKLIVSGSSAFYLDRKFKDSLAGRKLLLPVRTLPFREYLRFREAEDLITLLPDNYDADNYRLTDRIAIQQREKLKDYYLEYLLYGGYPKVVLAPLSEKPALLQDLAFSYIKKDIFEANIRQDEIFYRLFKILAGQTGGLVNLNELSNTLAISRKAVGNYLYVMQKSYHIVLIRPFYRNTRKELTKMPKIFFYDLGLRNFFVNNFESALSRRDRGELLENGVVRQFIDRADLSAGDRIKYWRSKSGAEVDVVFDEKAAFEVKFDAGQFSENKYHYFNETYPDVKINIVALSGERTSSYPVWDPWMV